MVPLSTLGDDDPFDWTIERVVDEFCHNPQPCWTLQAKRELMPKPDVFEKAIRDNMLDGESLLSMGVTEIAGELGVTAYGSKRNIFKAIMYLRSISPEYQRQNLNEQVIPYLQGIPRSFESPQVTASNLSMFPQSPPVGNQTPVATYASSRTNNGYSTVQFPSIGADDNFPPGIHGTKAGLEFNVQHCRSSTAAQLYSAESEQDGPLPTINIGQDLSNRASGTNEAGLNPVFEIAGGIRAERVGATGQPRTSQTDIRTPIGGASGAPDEPVMKGSGALLQQLGPNDIRSLARKRIAPTLVSDIGYHLASVPAVAQFDNREIGHNTYGNDYLGRSRQGPEDIFSPVDCTLDLELLILGRTLPAGQRKLVGGLLKAFLQTSVRRMPATSSYFRVPYRRSRLREGDTQRFMLFMPGLEAVQQRADDWPAVRSIQNVPTPSMTDTMRGLQNRPTEGVSDNPFSIEAQQESYDQQYDYLLQKYPPIADDEVLVPFGESGDEGEYDSETWEEIQAEKTENMLLKNPQVLTLDTINATIDEAISDLKARWHKEKFMKVKGKAYRLWNRAARENSGHAHTEDAKYWFKRFENSIRKMREAICKDTWLRASDVKAQCASLEESVFQSEEQQYLLSVLQNPQQPPRPEHFISSRDKKADSPILPYGEEILESESETSLDDGFIADESSSDAESIPHDLLRKTSELADAVENRTLVSSEMAPGSPAPVQQEAYMNADLATRSSDSKETESEDSDDKIISSLRKRHVAQYKEAEGRMSLTHSEEQSSDSLPSAADAEGTDYDTDSNLEGSTRLPNTGYRYQGRTVLEPIELLSSSPPASSPSARENVHHDDTTDFEVHTPELNPIKEFFTPVPKIKLHVVQDNITPLSKSSSSSSARLKLSQPSRDGHALENVTAVQETSWKKIVQNSDHRLALAKAVYALDMETAFSLQRYVERIYKNEEKSTDVLRNSLLAIQTQTRPIDGVAQRYETSARCLCLLFVSYNFHRECMDELDISEEELNEAYDCVPDSSRKFYRTLRVALNVYCTSRAIQKKRGKKRKLAEIGSDHELADDSDILTQLDADEVEDLLQEPGTQSHRKRKRRVVESQEAIKLQLNDQLRIEEQERRKAALAERMRSMEMNEDNPASHAISFSEPIIYLDPHIGARVKPHQVTGIQFMWREITAGGGCLLAHTMGLGKTMQVISLLVTLVQASQSADPDTRNQVPEELRELKALILAPPTLLNNWAEELLMWMPPDLNMLGVIRKITSEMRSQDRPFEIRAWARDGGILLMSYDLFRQLASKSSKTMTEEQRTELADIVLKQPNIIVADEAHKMKNVNSKISKMAKEFRSRSRIALTGSPLSNALEEYHQMVDWIAPNYLGDLVQFKDKYSEPINAGLYADSSKYERKVSARKLMVLKRDLEPKICRADISAIAKDMPSKAEFFITIPLTELQQRAYKIYIQYLLHDHGSRSGTSMTKLFDWLAVLSLLLNHPSAFVKKLEERKRDAGMLRANVPDPTASERHASEDTEDSTVPQDPSVSNIGLSAELVDQAIGVFRNAVETSTLSDIRLSYRSLLVAWIVKGSMNIGDKVLIFSHSIPTLNYLEDLLQQIKCKYLRIDGTTKMSTRQEIVKTFNTEAEYQAFIISTTAGGLGLNFQGANRVVIYDSNFNPTWEEQAIGRAYRLGQQKPVFVYRFSAGGTFEQAVNNKAMFKTQLFARVVDKRNPMRYASKNLIDYLFPPRDVPQADLQECVGKDIHVLDRILQVKNCIRKIELTETFQVEEDEELDHEDMKQIDEEYADMKLAREDPHAFRVLEEARQLSKQKAYEQSRLDQQRGMLSSSARSELPPLVTPVQEMNVVASETTSAGYPSMPNKERLEHLGASTGTMHRSSTSSAFGPSPSAAHRPPQHHHGPGFDEMDMPHQHNPARKRQGRHESAEPRSLVPRIDGANEEREANVGGKGAGDYFGCGQQ